MADFCFYLEQYKGSAISDIATFERLLIEAQALVDSFVINRALLQIPIIEQKYNFAICSVIDEIYEQETNDSTVKSETVGEHTKTYATRTEQDKVTAKKNKALIYLRGTGLMTCVIR